MGTTTECNRYSEEQNSFHEREYEESIAIGFDLAISPKGQYLVKRLGFELHFGWNTLLIDIIQCLGWAK